MKVVFEDMHNSWLYCFTNPLELGTLFKFKMLHQEASVETITLIKWFCFVRHLEKLKSTEEL